MSPVCIGEELWELQPKSLGDALDGRLQSLDCANEPLTTELAVELSTHGLHIQRRTTLADLAIQRAGKLIHRVPSLERVVLTCVREILMLDAPDQWHDVSHSEPRWPNLIFISLPPQTLVGDLRLTEAIVHEAMHLNLSFLEFRAKLIAEDRELFSPWRLGPRPAGGVLHGVYVFASLLRFFEILRCQGELQFEQQQHFRRRCGEILDECNNLPRRDLLNALTDDGQVVARRIFETIDHSLAARSQSL